MFLVVRHYVVPKSFGQYGHYRGAAMGEIAAHPAKFAGHETCEACHSDVADKKKAGKHAHLNCEACHGRSSEAARRPAQANLYGRFLALVGNRFRMRRSSTTPKIQLGEAGAA